MPATLIYDAECPLCCRAMEWVGEHAWPDEFEFLPCQSSERAERFPEMADAACLEAVQLVLPDGTAYSGEHALPHLFRRLKRYRWMARVFGLPGVSLVSPHAYRFVARNRHTFSVLIAKKVTAGPDSCPADDRPR